MNLKTTNMSYFDACVELMRSGVYSPTTKMLINSGITFDMRELGQNEIAIMANRVTNKRSSVKYAIAEFLWYASRRRTIELIEPFGKIWGKMTDSEGLVNSNYGYQIFHNQDVEEKLKELIEFGKADFYIASHENIESRQDATCNNLVRLYLKDGIISAEVYARSIDLLFGYPYDILSAQIFIRYIQRALRSKFGIDTKASTINMLIHNMHVYLSNLVGIDDYHATQFNSYEHFVMNSDMLFESFENLGADSITLEDVEEIRERLSSDDSFVTIRNLAQNVSMIQTERSNVRVYQMSYEDLIMMIDIENLGRAYRVVEYLRKDKFDRKNAILNDGKLLYVDLIDRNTLEVTEIA